MTKAYDKVFQQGMAKARKDEAMRKAAPYLYNALKALLAEYESRMTDYQTTTDMVPWEKEPAWIAAKAAIVLADKGVS